jgi:hypothetical protein
VLQNSQRTNKKDAPPGDEWSMLVAILGTISPYLF